jgi:beta-glucosidase
MNTLDDLGGNAAVVTAVQERAKNIAYNVTHSHAMNIGNAEIIPITPWWQLALYGATVFFGVLTVLGAVMWVLSSKKNKKD